jgi:hypothetical protein
MKVQANSKIWPKLAAQAVSVAKAEPDKPEVAATVYSNLIERVPARSPALPHYVTTSPSAALCCTFHVRP